MKILIGVLVVVILALQYRLWFGEGSLEQVAFLKREIERQKLENERLQERNRMLMAQIEELKTGLESIEAKARADMGMIKEGETFIQLIPGEDGNEQTQ